MYEYLSMNLISFPWIMNLRFQYSDKNPILKSYNWSLKPLFYKTSYVQVLLSNINIDFML